MLGVRVTNEDKLLDVLYDIITDYETLGKGKVSQSSINKAKRLINFIKHEGQIIDGPGNLPAK